MNEWMGGWMGVDEGAGSRVYVSRTADIPSSEVYDGMTVRGVE